MKTVTIAGNIGKDAAIHEMKGGDKVTRWSVAVNDGFGEKKRTLWFDCAMFGLRGEKVAQYLTKGGKVTVSGDMSTREHEGKTYLTIRVAEVALQGGEQRQDRGGYEPERKPQSPPGDDRSGFDSEIPF